MPFDCPKCKKPASRLVAGKDFLGCDGCLSPKQSGTPAVLHRVRYRGIDGMRLTEADAQHIKTNKKRPDGRFKPDPRWR